MNAKKVDLQKQFHLLNKGLVMKHLFADFVLHIHTSTGSNPLVIFYITSTVFWGIPRPQNTFITYIISFIVWLFLWKNVFTKKCIDTNNPTKTNKDSMTELQFDHILNVLYSVQFKKYIYSCAADCGPSLFKYKLYIWYNI